MVASVALFWHELFRPGNTGPHGGYWFWSGIEGSVPQIAYVWIAYTLFRRHNCHVDGCWRIQFKPHPDDAGHLVCRKHHKEAVK